jgi:hypothetical protein
MSQEIEQAVKLLRGYYKKLAEEVAHDLVEHAEDFDTGFGQADTLLERHSRRLCELSNVFAHLVRFAPTKKPQGKEPLGENEFRCFGCGDVIREDDVCCTHCGWTWK